jgi:general secretion pathway protein G
MLVISLIGVLKVNARNRRRRRGFTLMEVLLVLAILVILGSLVTVSYVNIQKGASIRSAQTQLNLLDEAIGLYQLDIGRIPASLDALREMPADIANPAKYNGPYLKTEVPLDPWNTAYIYEADNQAGQYTIKSLGPDGVEGNDDIVKQSGM